MIITTALLFQDLISWYLVLASLFLVLPFLIVHPFGPRAVFGSQLLLLIWWGRLWQAYLPKPKWLQAITVFLMVLTLFCMTTILLPIYEGKVASTRLIQYEATQNFQPRYYLEVPHHDWWWNPSISQNFDYAQQKFYHIYPYAAGTLVPYQTWKKKWIPPIPKS